MTMDLQRIPAHAPTPFIVDALGRDGAVIVEDLLDADVLARFNAELRVLPAQHRPRPRPWPGLGAAADSSGRAGVDPPAEAARRSAARVGDRTRRLTADNGATRVVPGSHRWAPDRIATDDELVPAEMAADSAVGYLGAVRVQDPLVLLAAGEL